jgi:hypothetical protein
MIRSLIAQNLRLVLKTGDGKGFWYCQLNSNLYEWLKGMAS